MKISPNARTIKASEAVVLGVKDRLPTQYFMVFGGSLLYSEDGTMGTFAVVLEGIKYGLVGARFYLPEDDPDVINATIDTVVEQLIRMNPPTD